jgi:hypothetical protein
MSAGVPLPSEAWRCNALSERKGRDGAGRHIRATPGSSGLDLGALAQAAAPLREGPSWRRRTALALAQRLRFSSSLSSARRLRMIVFGDSDIRIALARFRDDKARLTVSTDKARLSAIS